MPMIERRSLSRMTWVFKTDDYESARRARHEFASYIERCRASADAVAESAVIFGELVGNVVRHVGGEVRVQLTMDGSQPVLCVSDRAAFSRVEIPNRAPESETGRGLRIVHALAREVWIERGQSSKTICAALPCRLQPRIPAEKGDIPI